MLRLALEMELVGKAKVNLRRSYDVWAMGLTSTTPMR